MKYINLPVTRVDSCLAMFEHDMEEKKSSRVEVKDVEADVMAEMLRLVTEKIKVMIHLYIILKTENCRITCLQKKDGPFHNQVVLYLYTCGINLFKRKAMSTDQFVCPPVFLY